VNVVLYGRFGNPGKLDDIATLYSRLTYRECMDSSDEIIFIFFLSVRKY